MEFLILFLSIFFWGSPIGLSYFLGHLGAVIISFSTLGNLSKNCLFWVLIFITVFTAQELRFSLEYILFAMTFFYIGAGNTWISNDEKNEYKRKNILLWIFLFLIIVNYLRCDFSERGSLLLWSPVFLSLYYKQMNKKNFSVYLLSGLALFFSNKLTSLLALIVSTRSKIVYLLSVFLISGHFLYKQDLNNFLIKSIEPRLYITKSAWEGFLQKPLFGHGFGTFALDFPLYRTHAKVLGGRICEQIVHGHSLFNHIAFETGLIGLILIGIVLYLIYINIPRALLPLLVISLCDSPLVTFNQYLLAGLLVIPFLRNKGIFKVIFLKVPIGTLSKISTVLAIFLSLYIFTPSLIGHYYYEAKDIDRAIKWDNKNSLYYFTRGANNLNKNIVQSEKDLYKAIALSPSVSYFYGFLGAAQLANNEAALARQSLEKAMKLDGSDGYWCLLYSYANYNDKKMFLEYQTKALQKNPEIEDLISKPNLTSAQYIGSSKHGDVRLAGFYRTGENIFFPLPIIDK